MATWRAPGASATTWSRGPVSSWSPTAVPRGDVRVAANVVDVAGPRPEADAPPPTSDTMVFARRRRRRAPDSASRAFLLVHTDGAPPVRFDLGGALISIGRASDNDVIVDDPEVSRHHCQLKLQHGAYSLADLGSRTARGSTASRSARWRWGRAT